MSPLFLSSGAEDYFLSASYFDEGMFKTPNSGLTYFNESGSLGVYKTHDRDSVVWHDGMQLVFRNCEATAGCGDLQHCPNQYCPPGATASSAMHAGHYKPMGRAGTAAPRDLTVTYSTLVWLYQWPTRDATPSATTNSVNCIQPQELHDLREQNRALANQLHQQGLHLRRLEAALQTLMSTTSA